VCDRQRSGLSAAAVGRETNRGILRRPRADVERLWRGSSMRSRIGAGNCAHRQSRVAIVTDRQCQVFGFGCLRPCEVETGWRHLNHRAARQRRRSARSTRNDGVPDRCRQASATGLRPRRIGRETNRRGLERSRADVERVEGFATANRGLGAGDGIDSQGRAALLRTVRVRSFV